MLDQSWSNDIDKAVSIMDAPAGCGLVVMIYNQPLKKYIISCGQPGMVLSFFVTDHPWGESVLYLYVFKGKP